MDKYLIDTNTCAFFLRGKYGVKEWFQKVGIHNCCISDLTVFELKVGAEITKHLCGRDQTELLNLFFDSVTILPSADIHDYAAVEKARLRFAGTPSEDFIDLVIGCTSVLHDCIMVTENLKDFKNIKNIKLENWVDRSK